MSKIQILSFRTLLIATSITAHAQVPPVAPGVSRTVANSFPLSVLLQRSRDLGLSDEQVRTLDSMRNQLQKNTLKQNAAIQIAELELLELESDPAFEVAKLRTKLSEIEGARTQLRLDTISAARQARDVLSQAQRQRVEPLLVATPIDQDTSLESSIRQNIQTAIREQLRDQKVVEVETTEAIVDRLASIGKLLLLIGGIPLAILSFFGVRKLTNLTAVLKLTQKQLEEARDQVKATREQADLLVTQQQGIKQTAEELNIQYQKIRADANRAVQEISIVQTRVTEEGEKATLAIRTTAVAFNALPPSRAEAKTKVAAKPTWPSDGSVLTIPVVVHIVYHTDAENISDAQVQTQIDALNLDFRARNPDISKVPEPFKEFIGDAQIEFALATEDPLGHPTTGITRSHTKRKEFYADGNVALPKKGGAKAWDAARYLNIWVCNLGQGLLSSSQLPGGSQSWDGVVVTYQAFGTIGTAAKPFDKGRSATSGIAKYLNLLNLWSEDCKDSDLVSDTPPQKHPNFGTPAFPHISCNNGPHGDMFMNFMDYVDDETMCMFTKGQVLRMHETLLGPRRQLGRSS